MSGAGLLGTHANTHATTAAAEVAPRQQRDGQPCPLCLNVVSSVGPVMLICWLRV